jgi:pyruvate/2-oxoglutarate/acetoin dehydrogenase E1 component
MTGNVLRMPRLSDSMTEATILAWLKQPGETFLRGEPLFEVETDKATVVYEAEADGLLDEILVLEGGIAALGEPVARLAGENGGDMPRTPTSTQGVSEERADPTRPAATSSVPAPSSSERSNAGAKPVTTTIDFRTAVREALDEELAADDRVLFFGEDVAVAGGVFAVTTGLYEKYGLERVFDTPISELALAGAAFGAAISGLRPVIEIMFGDFLTLAMDSLVNQSTKYWYLTGERVPVPLVIRSVVGAGGRFGAIHSQMPVSWFMGVPGLKIVCPATPGDAKGLLRSAIRDDNPVLFFEHKRLYGVVGDVEDVLVPIGVARIALEGTDVTIVSAMNGVHESLKAAEILVADGIAAEVIDLRTLRPLDIPTILTSVAKTNRVVVVEEGPLTGGWAGEVLARVTEEGLGDLDDAWRIATAESPVPYSPPLEDSFLPSAERIASEIRARTL